MNKVYILVGLILSLSVISFSQKAKTSPDSEPAIPAEKRNKGKVKSGDNPSMDSAILQAGTNLEAQLQSAVDVRRSQVGDQVVLKTTKSIKQNGEVIVPKGTNLVGRITEIQQKSKENATSKIGMVFDRIEGKNLAAPLNASIVSVLSAQSSAAVGDVFASDMSGSSTTSGRTSSSGSGGGLLGGVGSTVGGVVNTATSTVGGVAGTATNTVGNTTGTLGRTVNGLQISSAASGSASGSSTISSQDKNLKFDKGATFQLQVNSSVQN